MSKQVKRQRIPVAYDPSMPGISIWSQSGNNVYFDKPAYNEQGRYIFATVTNGCTTSPTQTGIYFADPPGFRMSAFPTIADEEVTVDFGSSLSQFASKVDYNGKLDNTFRTSKLLLYNENNVLVKDFSHELKSPTIKVSTSRLKPGTYYFKAIFEDNTQEVKRLIIK